MPFASAEIILTHTVRPTDGESMQQFYDKFDVTKIDKGPAFGDLIPPPPFSLPACLKNWIRTLFFLL
jgi:hypothetical protein